jgi:hypothetical protein
MRILLIGGTGFIGSFLAPELQRLGAEVATLSRGATAVPHADGLTRIIADRKRLRDALPHVRAFAPDVIVDLVLSSGAQARELMNVARGIAGRVLALSSIDVYRACGVLHGLEEGPLEPVPLTETSALRTKLSTYPPAQIAVLQQVFPWLDDEYDKIPVEHAILGDSSTAGTVLRLPMIYGPGDALHRLWPLVKRFDDGRRTRTSRSRSRSRRHRSGPLVACTTSPNPLRTRSSSGHARSPPLRGGPARSSSSRATGRPNISVCQATSSSTGWPIRPGFGRSSGSRNAYR